ncbi:MAG: PAS domain-containing protein [Rhizobiales bacterium]|nr:PAS domain-containing protein [Hyphomicrobiales bacterium]
MIEARVVLIAAGVVLTAFTAAGKLSVLQALGGFAVMVAAAVIGMARGAERGGQASPVSPPALVAGDPLLETVIAGIPDPVVALDREGRVLALNATAGSLSPALRRGDPASIALRMPELVEAIRSANATGEPQRIEFSERVPVDRWYEAVVAPVGRSRDAQSGSREFLLVTFRDLTPLRQVEEMRADFVANASHELRTPLAALSGFIETLQGPARDDQAAQRRFLPIMHAQAARMARLIDDLLSLSRIELNAHRRPGTPLDVMPLVRQVVDGLQTLARDRDVAIKIQAPAQPHLVLGDRDELIRVFENLIENALKYGAAGKRVEIVATPGEMPDGMSELRIAVRDHGPGIAPEHLPRLTERFYRVDVAESREQGGTGLGLALVKHILNRHRGRLSIASTPGAGATFTAHIPLLTAEAKPAKGQA